MRLVVAAFCVFAFSAAGADRTLKIRNASSAQSQQELATVVRAMLDIASAEVDVDRRALTVTGTESQIAAAEWLLTEMDKPAPMPGDKLPASSVYRADGLAGDGIRVFYAQGGRPAHQLQEAATVIRSIVDIRRLFTYNQVGGIAVRGTPEQLEAAEWVWRTLETNEPTPGTEEFRATLPDGQQVLRAYRMPMEWSVQELQEAATLMRAIVELRRLFTYNGTRTIITRGDDVSIAAANWVVAEAKRPASQDLAESEPFRMEDSRQEGVVRVFRLPAGKFDAAGLQRVAVDIRKQTQIRRVFTFNTPRMIALRGTGAQIALAQRLIAAAK